MNSSGHISPGLWAHPRDKSAAYTDLQYWTELARTLERGKFDALFLADATGIHDVYRGSADAALAQGVGAPINDPFLVVPAMAVVTEHLGFGITGTVTYEPPYLFARRITTLDHLTKGRIAWNIVTGYLDSAAKGAGLLNQSSHDDRYDVADEYMDVVYKLWEGSWDDDAVIRDQSTGRYIDRDRLHYVDFVGEFFSVRGPSITPRSPQAQPLVALDADLDESIVVAAEHADVVFIERRYLEAARSLRNEIRERARAHGRRDDEVFVLARADVFFGTTAEREILDARSGERWNPGPLTFTESAAEFAELAEEWFRAGAVDGFLVRPALLPRGLDQLVEDVVPRLRERGVFRPAYEGRTLRDHFGLERPASRYEVSR